MDLPGEIFPIGLLVLPIVWMIPESRGRTTGGCPVSNLGWMRVCREAHIFAS
jgi:hypothetical protein